MWMSIYRPLPGVRSARSLKGRLGSLLINGKVNKDSGWWITPGDGLSWIITLQADISHAGLLRTLHTEFSFFCA